MAKPPQTVIGVPGRWPDRGDIVKSIALRSGGYLFAGMVMMNTSTEEKFSLEVYEHDPSLGRAFSIAGRGRLSDQELKAIEAHTFTLYLGAPGGSVDSAKKMLLATEGLLKAGGLAVKIESTGIAHSVDQWAEICKHDHLGSLLQAYVAYIVGKGVYYSCGMHNLGHPDAFVEADIHPDDAARLLHAFVGYLLIENPTLNDRETFSVDAEAPRYRLFRKPCSMYKKDSLFDNPFGVWKLIPT